MELTRFSQQDFETLLSKYNIGTYRSHSHIDFALENTDYIVNTSKGNFFVKVFESTSRKDVEYLLTIEEHLMSLGAKVPKVIYSRDNENIVSHKRKPVTVYEFVKGRHPKRFSRALVIDLAESLGSLDQKLMQVNIAGRKSWPMADKLIQCMQEWKPAEGFVAQAYDDLCAELSTLDYGRLRTSIIHSDVSNVNFLVRGDKVTAFIDWGDAHRDYTVYEVAVPLAHIFANSGGFKTDKLSLFMQHYQKHVRLEDKEKRALYTFIKVRLMSAILWCNMQKQRHPEQVKHLNSDISYYVAEYKAIERFGLDKFLGLF